MAHSVTAMSPIASGQPNAVRKPWSEPTLIRHESLMAVTRAPLSPEMVEVAITASMVMMQIGGSQGFYVSPGGDPQNLDPNGPPTQGYSGW